MVPYRHGKAAQNGAKYALGMPFCAIGFSKSVLPFGPFRQLHAVPKGREFGAAINCQKGAGSKKRLQGRFCRRFVLQIVCAGI